jgi:hypothetical protein
MKVVEGSCRDLLSGIISENYCIYREQIRKCMNSVTGHLQPLLSARQEKSAGKLERLLRMRTPPIPIPNTLYSSTAVHCVYEWCCRGGRIFCVLYSTA